MVSVSHSRQVRLNCLSRGTSLPCCCMHTAGDMRAWGTGKSADFQRFSNSNHWEWTSSSNPGSRAHHPLSAFAVAWKLEKGPRGRKIQAPLHTRSGWPVVPLFKKKMRSLNFIPRGLWFPQKLKVESIGSLPFCREICD